MKVPKQFLRQLDHGGATTYYDARSRGMASVPQPHRAR